MVAGLDIRDFWDLTPRDVGIACAAYNQRRSHDQALAAWHVAHVINLVAKHPVSPARLLGHADGKVMRGQAQSAMNKAISDYLGGEGNG